MTNRSFLVLAWLAAILITAVAFVAIFPEVLSPQSLWMRTVYLMAILTLIGSSLILYPRMSLHFALKATVIWLCIGLILILAYRFYSAT